MTEQSYFETVNTERALSRRARAPVTKPLAREERRRLSMLDMARQKRQGTEAMLRDLRHAVRLLDHSIEAELEGSRIRDPSHFAFPMTARTLLARRDNLKATIAALADQLTMFERSGSN